MILEAHRKWLESGGREGQRANLSRTNLQKADLLSANLAGASLLEADLRGATLTWANLTNAAIVQADLRSADLVEANLSGAKLFGANLRGAELRKANLTQADLSETNLRDTDLQDAELTDATGLLSGQLGGANVSGAKLPEAIRDFEGLKIVDEASKNARKLFVSVLLGCLYTWLTIATTTDARLLTNSASATLPIIGSVIPIAGFYWVAPLLLLALYVYLHVYLQRLWETLADLPAVFPDGRPLDNRAYPWLLNGLVRAHFFRLRDDRPSLSHLQTALSLLLAWWVVPLTVVLFWTRYLSRHDWAGTAIHIAVLVVLTGFAITSYLLATTTLRGKRAKPFFWKKAWQDVRTYTCGAVVLGISVIFSLLSFGVIEGIPPERYRPILLLVPGPHPALATLFYRPPDLKATDIRRLVPQAFALLGYSHFADLQEADVSTKPDNWTGRTREEHWTGPTREDIALVKGARLERTNLRYAAASRAFLVKADLRQADLQGANLRGADLRGANLEKANLRNADLREADLREANLYGADLREIFFLMTNLYGAILVNANLEGVAAFQSTTFQKADLRGANLRRANLKGADLRHAKLADSNFQEAYLEGADLQGADLAFANLRDANLTRADLRWAMLSGAYLERANFEHAKLQGANFRDRPDPTPAVGLSRRQIKSAIIDEKTRLPDYLQAPVKTERQAR